MDSGTDPFPALEPEAAAAVERALHRAATRGRENAGPIDLLAAILDISDSSATTLLQLSGVSTRAVADALEAVSDTAGNPVGTAQLGPDALEVLDVARREARRLGHEGVWSVHLLLAILQGKPGVARTVIESAGLDLDAARELARYLYDPSSAEPPDFSRLQADGAYQRMSSSRMGRLEAVENLDPESTAWVEQRRAEYERMRSLFDPEGPDELLRVVAVGQTLRQPAGRVELIAIEMRTARALIYWRARPSVSGEIAHRPEFEVADDVGTAYFAMSGSSGGGDRGSSGEAHLAPVPPATAKVLTVTLRRFSMDGPTRAFFLRQARPLEGPWVFEVPLG